MELKEFVRTRKPEWEEFETLLARAEKRGVGGLTPDELERLGRRHRRINADYAFADTFFDGSRVARYLNGIVARAHTVIYRRRRRGISDLKALFTRAPGCFRKHCRLFIVALVIFAVSGILGYESTMLEPDLAATFLPEATREEVRQGRVWTEGILNVMPGSLVAVQVFARNLGVLILSFATGLTVVGTAYILLLNGFMLGCLIAFCEPYGMADELLTFTIAHGPLEISAILLAAAAGLMLAWSVLSPGLLPRGLSLKRTAREALPLFAVALVALMVAGVLEGLVSTDDEFSVWARMLAGFPPAAALFFYLICAFPGEPQADVMPGERADTVS